MRAEIRMTGRGQPCGNRTEIFRQRGHKKGPSQEQACGVVGGAILDTVAGARGRESGEQVSDGV